MKFAINTYTWTKYGYQDKVVVEAEVEADSPRAALEKVFANYELGYGCPRYVEEVFEETKKEFHAETGKFSFDVCPANW